MLRRIRLVEFDAACGNPHGSDELIRLGVDALWRSPCWTGTAPGTFPKFERRLADEVRKVLASTAAEVATASPVREHVRRDEQAGDQEQAQG